MQRVNVAREPFKAYLREQPDAEGRAMVEAYLRQIQ
jgi:hypothetical protein